MLLNLCVFISDVWIVCQIAFVASLKEMQSQFYLLPFIANDQYAFFSPLGFASKTWSWCFRPQVETQTMIFPIL